MSFLLQNLEASIHIPADIFKSVRCIPVCSHSFKLQFVAYKNAKLFPLLGPSSSDMVVKSSVISARIGTSLTLRCLSLLIIIIIR